MMSSKSHPWQWFGPVLTRKADMLRLTARVGYTPPEALQQLN